jgi:hypothetical protein
MEMDEPARGWMINYARKNFWRVSSWYEMADLIQDGYLTYYRIADRYREAITSRAHMMSLFKVSFINHVHDLAKAKMRYPEVPIDDFMGVLLGNNLEDVSLIQASLPREVRAFLRQLQTERGRKHISKPYTVSKKGRETTNKRWCRIVGADPSMINMPELVKESIKGVA